MRGVDGARLPDLLPPPLRRRLPSVVIKGGPYTVLLFPLHEDPVKAGAVAKALARLDEGGPTSESTLAFAADFTMDAAELLAGRGIATFTVGDFHWTDASYERIRASIASPKKARGGDL
jgi:hypothetical protein